MNVIFPNTTPIIDAIRSGIGRIAYFYTVTRSGCPACSIDPVTDTSTNSFCVVCSGEGYIYTYAMNPIMAHITHNPSELPQWNSAGQFVDGDCRLQVKYTEEIAGIVANTNHVVVDGKTFEIKKQMRRGVKEINRIILDLKEKLSTTTR